MATLRALASARLVLLALVDDQPVAGRFDLCRFCHFTHHHIRSPNKYPDNPYFEPRSSTEFVNNREIEEERICRGGCPMLHAAWSD